MTSTEVLQPGQPSAQAWGCQCAFTGRRQAGRQGWGTTTRGAWCKRRRRACADAVFNPCILTAISYTVFYGALLACSCPRPRFAALALTGARRRELNHLGKDNDSGTPRTVHLVTLICRGTACNAHEHVHLWMWHMPLGPSVCCARCIWANGASWKHAQWVPSALAGHAAVPAAPARPMCTNNYSAAALGCNSCHRLMPLTPLMPLSLLL